MVENNKMSAFEVTYEKIRDMIFNGELSNGQKITETKLAEQLGVSRTPIREAIKRLEQEKLIAENRVANPTDRDYQNIFEMRILIEKYAIVKAVQFFTDSDVEEMERLVEIGYSGTKEETMEANKAFHERIVAATKNDVMIDYFNQMQSIIYLFRKTVLHYKRPGLIDEHKAIVDAIKDRDASRAERLIEEHLQADLDFALYYLRK
ncbi:GntR family transcriptional regulator [Caldibacillus lycopersici]|uniref:GntR family transcriptional regulator n=1 Tax=Perspicuibacillus lycopersici TaxID=1325689 RepID=A0AAE3IRB8_9BACI|nr:GntR family transcriptional regulator [Perspicuibacillus lycopersici]MCU9613012.1 GntR family transcriptional regulator [Perspicuibacillus lycopersici]